jgi:hypothetical protein
MDFHIIFNSIWKKYANIAFIKGSFKFVIYYFNQGITSIIGVFNRL